MVEPPKTMGVVPFLMKLSEKGQANGKYCLNSSDATFVFCVGALNLKGGYGSLRTGSRALAFFAPPLAADSVPDTLRVFDK